MADVSNNYLLYKVTEPSSGKRAELSSSTPLYVLLRTVKTNIFRHAEVQQSDYTFAWNSNDQYTYGTNALHSPSPRSIKSKLKNIIKELPVGSFLTAFYLNRLKSSSLSTGNEDFKRVPISSLC